MTPAGMSITREAIGQALKALGIRRGQAIVVHGSLKRFGRVEGGAEAVVEALLEAVGPEGLVTMPVYSSSEDQNGDLLREPAPDTPVSTGVIPAEFRRHPQAVFAPHPLYAYAFYGKDAVELARKCERLLVPYGADQPLTCLFPRQGLIVQLGVDDITNTSIHVAEEMADPAYLADKKSVSGITVEEFFRLPVERRREILAKHRTGPRRDFSLCTPLITAAGLRRTATVGQAAVSVTDFTGMCRLLTDAVRRNPKLMLRPVS
jgi:aminoglycoside 3-N-acetyltransferase